MVFEEFLQFFHGQGYMVADRIFREIHHFSDLGVFHPFEFVEDEYLPAFFGQGFDRPQNDGVQLLVRKIAFVELLDKIEEGIIFPEHRILDGILLFLPHDPVTEEIDGFVFRHPEQIGIQVVDRPHTLLFQQVQEYVLYDIFGIGPGQDISRYKPHHFWIVPTVQLLKIRNPVRFLFHLFQTFRPKFNNCFKNTQN